jgi:hypothetical protein
VKTEIRLFTLRGVLVSVDLRHVAQFAAIVAVCRLAFWLMPPDAPRSALWTVCILMNLAIYRVGK